MAEPLAARLSLVLVTPGDRGAQATLDLVQASLAGGVSAVLLREKQLEDTARRTLYQRIVAACRKAGALALISGQPELARQLGAHGVQCGYKDPAVPVAQQLDAGLLVGRSSHWPLDALDQQVDWVTLSPFGPTPRSHPRPLLTEAQIRAALRRLAPRPVVALGGIDLARIPALPHGLSGVAVLRALSQAGDPRRQARLLRAAVDRQLR